MSLLVRLSVRRKYIEKIWQLLQFNKTLKWNHILLAAYLFSLRVLLDFFRQPSHTKLNKEKEKTVGHMLVLETPFKVHSQLYSISVQKTHPNGHIVSWCKTQIWCIFRPQSIHSTNLQRERKKKALILIILLRSQNFKLKVILTYSSGSSVSFFFLSNWSLLIDLEIYAYFSTIKIRYAIWKDSKGAFTVFKKPASKSQ